MKFEKPPKENGKEQEQNFGFGLEEEQSGQTENKETEKQREFEIKKVKVSKEWEPDERENLYRTIHETTKVLEDAKEELEKEMLKNRAELAGNNDLIDKLSTSSDPNFFKDNKINFEKFVSNDIEWTEEEKKNLIEDIGKKNGELETEYESLKRYYNRTTEELQQCEKLMKWVHKSPPEMLEKGRHLFSGFLEE